MPIRKLPKLHSDFSVDCVIFGYDGEELKVLLIERNEEPFAKWMAIPGNLAQDNEDIDQAAARVLHDLTGLENVFMEQLQAFGAPNRHPQGRVITVAYYAIIKSSANGLHPLSSFATKAVWWPANQLPQLAFDHHQIVQAALKRLKNRIRYVPIGFELLPEKFSLTELQEIYEVILDKPIDKRNFRKKILSYGFLTELNQKQTGVSHRAARLYKFNQKQYEELKQNGFYFVP
ncbi:NUDIX domain-containing protein [Bacteroidota bacterium]